MSKVIFIEKKLRIDKLGIMYLSSVLKNAGHSVSLFQSDLVDLDKVFLSEKIDYVMYSVMSGEHRWFLEKNKELKSKYGFVSIVGGPHFTFFPEQGVEDESVDFVVVGPGEDVILDILEGKVNTKKVVGNLPGYIDDALLPDRDVLYEHDYFKKSGIRRFITTRVCRNACSYCFNHTFKRLYSDQRDRFYLRKSPEAVVEEIASVKSKYGLEMAYFNDDDLARDKEWIYDFCNIYKRKIAKPFSGGVRADSVSHELLDLMSDAGCSYLSIALESAVPSTQSLLRRGGADNDLVADRVRYAMSKGIKIRIMNMIGLPVDDPLGDALTTLKFNLELSPTDSWASIFQPLPRTDMWEYCLKHGFITKDVECLNFYDDTVLNIPDAEKINILHKMWFFMVYYKLDMRILEVLLESGFTFEQKQQLQKIRWDMALDLLY